MNAFKVCHDGECFQTVVATHQFVGFKTIANSGAIGSVKNSTF